MSNEEQKSITPGIYLWLIAVNIYISMFAFGGGYVVVPLVRRSFVEKKKIFTEDELMEMSAVAQSSPGGDRGESGGVVGGIRRRERQGR